MAVRVYVANKRVLRIEQVRTAAGSNNNIEKVPKTPKSRRSLYIVDGIYDILSAHKVNIQNGYVSPFFSTTN
ncbi:hypothetical protein GCM10008018_31250 [Paenibacillus marchantiophytorum]|uniref:Uncharacterized protein n=1 Tax=Paenibacillus marchantiophytorum TaxID=1619310 RepID=A0ABQ1ES50_9BACL|nr:hypothetical protein GCM10008018_31250 [Paenibacillus marchantiophytorum]